VEDVVEIVSVDVPEPLIGLLKLAVASVGKPLVANATVPVKFLVALTITVNIVFLAPFTDCVRGVTDTENSPLPPRLAQLESTAATKKTQQKATPTNGFHGHCFMRILQARV
jgi:hypothetical protein